MEPKFVRKRLANLGLEVTEMALREELMSYFKGSCVECVVAESPIYFVNLNDYRPRPRYSYQRRQYDSEQPQLIMLAGVPILTVHHAPDTIIFHTGTLGRSTQFRHLEKRLRQFLDRYLKGVRKEDSDAPVLFR